MRVGVVSSDVPSCELYRASGPAQALADAGEIEYVRLGSDQPLRVRYAIRRAGLDEPEHEPIGLAEVPDVDVVVFVRGVFPERMHDIIGFLQREGVAVVIDYDDDYRHLPPQLHQLYKINPNQNPHYNWRNAEQAGRLADVVTVSTPALKRYHDRAVVLRNCVPESYLQIHRPEHENLVVGWTGTVYGHPGDLRECRGGVAQALRKTGSTFLNIGDGVQIKEDLGLDQDPEVTGIVPLNRYPYEVAKLDVGIAPLVPTRYSFAKSSLKCLEYLALGVPYVASPTPEYGMLQAELEQWCALNDAPVPGDFVNARGRSWARELVKFLKRPKDEREKVSKIARQFVKERATIEGNAWRWAETWEDAMKRRKARS